MEDPPAAASALPATARAVLIGAGIVGNSLVHHLARLGWTDLVLIDKGPLPNPGGSTGHASNFIFPADHSREMTALTPTACASTTSSASSPTAAASRSRAPRSAWRSCAAGWPRQVLGGRAGLARHPRRDQGARPLHRRVGDHRRLLLPHRGRRRLAARGHPDARARPGVRSAHRLGEQRGARDRRRGRARQARADHEGRRRGRDVS